MLRNWRNTAKQPDTVQDTWVSAWTRLSRRKFLGRGLRLLAWRSRCQLSSRPVTVNVAVDSTHTKGRRSWRYIGDWLCVCVIKLRTFLRCKWISMGPMRSFWGPGAQIGSDAAISHTHVNIVTCTCGRWLLLLGTLIVQRNVAFCPTETLMLLGYGAIIDALDSIVSASQNITTRL